MFGYDEKYGCSLLARCRSKQLERVYTLDLGYSSDFDVRRQHLHEWLGKVGDNCIIEPPFRCDYGFNIEIGNSFYANFDCVFLDCNKIYIGNHVLLGPGVHLYTATHPLEAFARRIDEMAHPIRVGNDVWIGGRAILLPGVEIGDGCVIGAGSVVTRSIPAYSLAAGNPCRVIRSLAADEKT